METENRQTRMAGTKNPFNVPDRYFEDFTQELMSRLPEKESVLPAATPTLWQRVNPWIYMAAMFCGIMLSARIFIGKPEGNEFPITQTDAETLPDEEWEIMLQRTLINDYALYEYLTDAETNH